jgi:hypothetical protein
MLLAPYGGGFGENCNITGNTKTMAAACTSRGHRIVVSVCREPSSPALSRICLCFQPGTEIRIAGTESIIVSNSMASAYSTVVGAHGGSVLVQIPSKEDYSKPTAFDYFVYTNAAGAADPARPPSLHLLPPHPSSTTEKRRRWLDSLLDVRATGFLCRGEAEFVVAQLKVPMPPDGGRRRGGNTAPADGGGGGAPPVSQRQVACQAAVRRPLPR